MPRFDKSNFTDLKAFLYNCYGHDAKMERVNTDYENERIEISLFNPYFGVKMVYTFCGVEFILSLKGDWHGNRKEIIGVTVEDDFSYLETYLPNHKQYNKDSLYLLFQMFSGDELHIVSKEVSIEIVSGRNHTSNAK